MHRYIHFADELSAWFGKVFAWSVVVMTIAVSYEVVVRYMFNRPTAWAFDLSYMLYGTLFMMAGAYTLSRDGHVRGDFIYRLWQPRTQARLEFVLYFIFFFPGVLALIFAGWKYAARGVRFMEVSSNSPAGIPIWQFKAVIVAAGVLLFLQGIAQVFRCVICMRTGEWPRAAADVEETEKVLMESLSQERGQVGQDALDVPDHAAEIARKGEHLK